MANPSVHLDTWAIIEASKEGKYAGRVKKILWRCGPATYRLVASQTSLGEAAAVILRRGPDAERMLHGMIALLSDDRMEANLCMPPLDAAVIGVMRELADAVPGIDTTDVVILAHALADPDSVCLLTRDHALVNNPAIISYEKKMREAGRRNTRLRIVNPTETYPAD